MQLNPHLENKDIVSHFVLQGMLSRTVRNIIKRIRDGKDDKKMTGGGKSPAIMTERIKDKMIDLFDGKTNVSYRKAARIFNVSRQVIKKWLNNLDIKRIKRRKIPASNAKTEKETENHFKQDLKNRI